MQKKEIKTEKRKLTYDEIDDILEKIEHLDYQGLYQPTMLDLDIHHIESMVHEKPYMVEYLLYLQESMSDSPTEEEKMVSNRISSVISRLIVPDNSDEEK